jgi:hypothetical protein
LVPNPKKVMQRLFAPLALITVLCQRDRPPKDRFFFVWTILRTIPVTYRMISSALGSFPKGSSWFRVFSQRYFKFKFELQFFSRE